MRYQKKVLFICPSFYNYQKDIICEMELAGLRVFYFNEKIIRYPIIDVIKKRFPRIFEIGFKFYESYILRKVRDITFDYIFVIKGMNFSSTFFRRLANEHPNSRKILYSWDSMEYYNYLDKVEFFENVFSFDRVDCEKYPLKLTYLPLFYTKEYQMIRDKRKKKAEAEIDFLFIGDGHGDRLERLTLLYPLFREAGLNCKFILKSTFLGLLKRREQDKYGFLRCSNVNKREMIELMCRTRVVLDLPASRQSGLSIRSIEAMGAHLKLITSNVFVRREQFFDEENILLLGSDLKMSQLSEFVSQPFKECQCIESYSLRAWLNKMSIN